MHELHLAQDVLKVIKQEAKEKGLPKVSSGTIKIGESLITHPQEFMELFGQIGKGTIAEGIKLKLEILPLRALCTSCKKEFDTKEPRFDCPHCGSTDIKLSSGKELYIEDLK